MSTTDSKLYLSTSILIIVKTKRNGDEETEEDGIEFQNTTIQYQVSDREVSLPTEVSIQQLEQFHRSVDSAFSSQYNSIVTHSAHIHLCP